MLQLEWSVEQSASTSITGVQSTGFKPSELLPELDSHYHGELSRNWKTKAALFVLQIHINCAHISWALECYVYFLFLIWKSHYHVWPLFLFYLFSCMLFLVITGETLSQHFYTKGHFFFFSSTCAMKLNTS